MSEQKQHLWLRAETKLHEHRAALTPTTAQQLMAAGFEITVEQDPERIFSIDEYRSSVPPLLPLPPGAELRERKG